MNEGLTDFELLRDFLRKGDQGAFAALVRCHLNLVYGTALRKVQDHSGAEEVTQNVFSALSRKSWQFAPDDSLPAWLHRTALLEATSWLRGELRRRRREQRAAELGTTMNTSQEEPVLRSLVPLLDGALLSLREKDRAALLLRFYEGQSLRDVGKALGVGEDGAQKRVGCALEKLARFFQRRGFRTATSAVAASALQQTGSSAPAAFAASVIAAAGQAAPPAIVGFGALLARVAGLTKAQSAALCLAIIALPTGWQWKQARRAATTAATAQLRFNLVEAEHDRLSAEIDRQRGASIQLDAAIAAAMDGQTKNAATLGRWNIVAGRIRGLLTDPNYHWPDDVPYVRIPKSVVKEFVLQDKFMPSGKLSFVTRELLAMSPEEIALTEPLLANYWGGASSLIAARAYETNAPVFSNSAGETAAVPPGALTKTVVIPPLGAELKSLAQRTSVRLAGQLKEDRKDLLFGGWENGTIQLPDLGSTNFWNVSEEPQSFTVWVDPRIPVARDEERYGASWTITGRPVVRSSGEGSLNNIIPGSIFRQFFEPWVEQFGVTNKWPFLVP